MEILQKEASTFYRVFWLPLAVSALWILLSVNPFWSDYGLILMAALLAFFLSGAVLLWGICLVVLGLWLRARLTRLVLATFGGGLPFLCGVAAFLYQK